MASTVVSEPLPTPPVDLATSLNSSIHLLATTGHEKLAEDALNAAKSLFDLGLSLEPFSHPHLHPFLASLYDQAPAITTRSGGNKSKVEQALAPDEILPYTPLSGLTVDGLDADQVWEQLELRAKSIGEAVASVGEGNKPDFDEDDEEAGSEDEDEEGFGGSDDEEMTLEEYERLMAEQGSDFDSEEDDQGSEGSQDSADDSASGSEDDAVNFFDEEEGEGLEGGSEDDEMDEDMEGLEDEDDEDEEEEDDAPPSISQPSSSRSKKHPELDDSFFSIDAFNKQTEQAEAGRVTSGRLGGDEDDEEEEGLGDMAGMLLDDLGAPNDDDTVMYNDFFPPPREEYVRPPRGSGKEKDAKKSKSKSKGKGVSFGDDMDVDLDAEDAEDVERDVMGRVKGDLFADDDEAEQEEAEKNLSTHEKRQIALRAQIAQLESDVVGPKDWTLLGEASSRARPENSLLEENLEFEQVGKVVPVITEESVKTLEELIKSRIRDNNFNSPIRVRPMDTKPFLPSRLFEIEDQQSAKSLAQIYEDEYQTAAAGGKKRDARDEKLSKDHEDIETLWGEICYKLDALSSAHFVPKAPNAKITTVSNVATTSMETALPSMNSATTMLAPEELFAPPTAGDLRAKSEMTPEEKQKARQANRKRKQGQVKRLGDAVVNFGKKEKGGAKAEKERALAGLVKTGKGVTVVGKGGGSEPTSKRKRGEPSREDAKRLKL